MTNTVGNTGTWWDGRLLGLWILVNSVGYAVIVVGGTGLELLASSATKGLVEDHRAIAIVVAAVVGSGFQGVVLGRWQWQIIRRRLPRLRRTRWVVATLTPSFFIWLLVIAPGAVDVLAQGGDTLGAFRNGFVQALVLGPLIGASQALALRADCRRWIWWFVANVTTYLTGAAIYRLTVWLLQQLSLPQRAADYCPFLAFAIHGLWMLWVSAPAARRHPVE